MRTARRDQQFLMGFPVQLEREPFLEHGGIHAQVNNNIVNPANDAPDQFRLLLFTLEMQCTNDAFV